MICVSRPSNINIFQWNRKCFFLRHVQFEPEFHCDDDRWSHLGSTKKSARESPSSVVSVGSDSPVFSTEILAPYGLAPALDWIPGIRSLFLTILLYHLQMGIWIHHLLVWSGSLSRWVFEDEHLMRRTFPNIPCLPPEYLLSKFSPRSAHSQERLLALLSCQIDELLFDILEKSDDIQLEIRTVLLYLWMTLQIVFHVVFSHHPGGLGCFAESKSIPWNWTTTIHPDLTAEVPSFTRRTALSAMPVVSDWWGVEVRYFLDKTSHAFPHSIELSVYTTSVNATAPRILTHVSPSHVKILFYTDKIDACDLRAPRRHTGTIFEVHPGATTFPPVLSISATASALHGPIRFPQTPFQCPRSRTAALALGSRSTPALTQA